MAQEWQTNKITNKKKWYFNIKKKTDKFEIIFNAYIYFIFYYNYQCV